MLIPVGIFASSGGVAAAFELISTTILTGSQSQIVFSSIPSTYKHLQVRISGRTNTGGSNDSVWVRFNNDSANNYIWHELRGGGFGSYTVTSQTGSTSSTQGYVGYAPGSGTSFANAFGNTIVDVLDYASTSKYKTMRSMSGTNAEIRYVTLGSALWKATSAVTSVTVGNDGASWATGTRVSIYGIKG